VNNGQTPKKIHGDTTVIMKQYNVIFAGTARDVEKYIGTALKYIDICGKKFNDYSVIIYENDSKDSTREILETNKKSNYHYIFEDNIKEPIRTIRLANGRNKILEKVREINKDDYYNYLVLLDLDDINESGLFVHSIESCFIYDGWSVLTGNQTGEYYDLWALRKKDDMEYDCWLKVKQHPGDPNAEKKYVRSKHKNYPVGEPLEVDSAFGGVAIYHLPSVPNHCKYFGSYSNGHEKCEHIDFHRCIKDNGGSIYINTRFLTS
jgi:hypothetical protein